MSALLKDIYSSEFYNAFCHVLEKTIPHFEKEKFIKLIFDKSWKTKELKDRMKHTSFVLNQFLSPNFGNASKEIESIIINLRKHNMTTLSLEFMFLPHYIEIYGINNFNVAIKTLEFVTQFTSCEFAVRPFIIKYETKMLKQMLKWSTHKNHHVRRLASEGSRPRLPWAMALPLLKINPTPILKILDNLKNDKYEYVRRSVANNLNDIAKDNPQVVISIAKKWKETSKETDGIIKHGCRTLLKQGNTEILSYFQLSDSTKIEMDQFEIITQSLKIGSALEFSFTIKNNDAISHLIRLEYGIYYLRQNKKLSKKVFKISERNYKPKEICDIKKTQSFKIITTRKFYVGQQKLSIIVNGKEREVKVFELT